MDSAEVYMKRREAEREAGQVVGCVATYKGDGGHGDQYQCSCGWQSHTYSDGAEYAWSDWVAHTKERGAVLDYS